MIQLQLFQMDGKFDVGRSNYILNLEVRVAHCESHLLNNLCVFSTGQLALLLRSGPSNNHFSRTEDKTGGFWISKAHNNSGKSVRVIFSSLSLPGNLLQIELTAKIDGPDHILYLGQALLWNFQKFALGPYVHPRCY
jgi:hypothetical protein